MLIKLPIEEDKKYVALLEILGSCVSPFNKIRPKEREVLAELYRIAEKIKDVPEEEKYKILFHSDSKKEVANILDISIFNLGNIIGELKKKGLVDDFGLTKKLPFTDKVTFNFIIE